ncbi:MAG TPA: permease prefix domain 1-containing protein, partial [Microbacterium sp.]|nr:permease prefix domain 1-containing protein [Microbacterium sp.]
MNATTLTDRYVAAAMRTVPEKQRDDLAAELRASIDDQIEARVDGGEPRVTAERSVLTDLGDPDKLAAGYTERPLYLIGPRHYLDWWRLLKLLLAIVLPVSAFGVALGQTLSGAGFGEIVGSVIATLISVAVHLGFWT